MKAAIMLSNSLVRVRPTTRAGNPSCVKSLAAALLIFTGLSHLGNAQATGPSTPVTGAPLTTEQVVQNLVRRNAERAEALRSYQGTRTYRLEYRGFPSARSAEMVVNVKYLSPGTKEFVVQSATGSKLIIDKVFKKLLEAEEDALDAPMQRRTALNCDNYEFAMVGYETGPSGATYVLRVEPRRKDKFLYRGRIWVDAEDFAVVQLKAEPAKNPSFWIKNTEVEQVYRKVNDFWLPARNRSVSAIRLGGHAELTIEYKGYEVTGSNRHRGMVASGSSTLADTARTRR